MPERREGISFGKNVAAGGSGEMEHTVQRDATVERVMVRIYPGPETDLQLELFVDPTEGQRRPLVVLEGKSVIDGDDDTYHWQIFSPVSKDDEIVVKFTNQDGANSYDFRVNMELDYRSGVDSIIGRVAGVL